MSPDLLPSESAVVLERRPAHTGIGFLRVPRLVWLALLLVAEALVFSLWLDNQALASVPGAVPAFLSRWAAWIARGAVGAVVIFFTFGFLKHRPLLEDLSAQARRAPVRGAFLLVHAAIMALFALGGWALYGNHLAAHQSLAALGWLAMGITGLGLAAFAFIPVPVWIGLIRGTGALAIYAPLAVVPACIAGVYSQALWVPIARATFALVKLFLTPFASNIVADPAGMVLGTAKFSVEIAPQCSGFEGAGLILAFGTLWLLLFHRECRFPQALLLLPLGVAVIYLLNAVRITALILIGSAGAPQIALGGFHSQAGWLAFNAVALGFCVAARRIPWISAVPRAPRHAGGLLADNPTAVYLLPLLSILAAGAITTALSGDFEWLYPLRFLAAGLALWAFRQGYAGLDWKPGWFGPGIGVAVFALWIGADVLLHGHVNDAMPQPLAATAAPVRITWIAVRILAATVTVPIAEELAFRGFLLRRMISADFEKLPLRSFTWLGVAVSSIAFGLLHGGLWLPGILAGVLYAWAMLRRGSIGAAVAAHATTNALLAAYVLAFHQWHLW